MANKKDGLVADVAFIFAEVDRLQTIIREDGLAAVIRSDRLASLPDPKRQGFFYLCSRAADQRISTLADHAASGAGIARQVEGKLVKKHLKSVLSSRFYGQRRDISLSEVERALAEAVRLAKAERSTKTHFIPCHLVFVQDPEEFSVGPVRFLGKKRFRQRLAEAFWADRRALKLELSLLRDLREYYGSFGWVAEVTITNCDKGMSDFFARAAVTRALDSLHLLIGPAYSRKMQIGGPDLTRDLRCSFTLGKKGTGLSFAYPSAGQVGFEPGWFGMFDHPDYGRALELCGLALEASVDPSIERPLSNRFLDALHWFGEAVRDESPPARVVKYVTALERMLMTDEGKDIAATVTRRVAAFCCDVSSRASHAKWLADAQRVYALRSKLVHGSLSPNDPAVMEKLGTVAAVCQSGLIAALTMLGEPGLLDGDASTKKLAGFYKEFAAKRLAQLPEERDEPTARQGEA